MFGVGTVELFVMIAIGAVTFGVPIAALVLIYLIYRNTKK